MPRLLSLVFISLYTVQSAAEPSSVDQLPEQIVWTWELQGADCTGCAELGHSDMTTFRQSQKERKTKKK